MAEPAVVFNHVWKKFRRGERHNSLRDLIPSLVRRATRPRKASELQGQEFWAVSDVSFEVSPGEALGIIGPNGAGKSTTLKLLTRILRATEGSCSVKGRVGALIEVAAGFHPDLTGRENIFLQGAVMGMKQAEIARHLDEIIEFAGVRNFIDTQVKRYSSGMNARLGFAIAAHLDPDVLIIDEVLAVGDMSFQQRCIDRMERFKSEGVAIVFVSHNLQAVASLCDRALYLNREVRAIGAPEQVIAEYVASTGTGSAPDPDTTLHLSAQLQQVDNPMAALEPGTPLTLRVQFAAVEDVSHYSVAFRVLRATDQFIAYAGHFDAADLGLAVLHQGTTATVDFAFKAHLTRGQYFVDLIVRHNPTGKIIATLRPAAHLTVHETRTRFGVADLDVKATLRSQALAEDGQHSQAAS